jgi:hypothetical protein
MCGIRVTASYLAAAFDDGAELLVEEFLDRLQVGSAVSGIGLQVGSAVSGIGLQVGSAYEWGRL